MTIQRRKSTAISAVLAIILASTATTTSAQHNPGAKDVFKGKHFPPNIILEHRDALDLSKEPFKAIRAEVVEVQTSVAEHEWDLREAYALVLADLDDTPIDEGKNAEKRAICPAG